MLRRRRRRSGLAQLAGPPKGAGQLCAKQGEADSARAELSLA